MRVIPVLDLMNGVVVRGVAGRRETYRPVESWLTSSAAPLGVAQAIRDRFGLEELYVADLDAIQQARPNVAIWRALADDGFRLLIDAGVRHGDDAAAALAGGAAAVVAGLETLAGPAALRDICERCGGQTVFSLDLQAGSPLGSLQSWRSTEPFEIAAEAVQMGATRLIVLDLAAVGVGEGLSVLPLCRRIRERFPGLELITGGGVRGPEDLQALQDAGVDGALVATALHNGNLAPEHIAALRER